MAQLVQSYILNGEQYDLEYSSKSFALFTNKDSNGVLVTDAEFNVIATISADCAQNVGFLEVYIEESATKSKGK